MAPLHPGASNGVSTTRSDFVLYNVSGTNFKLKRFLTAVTVPFDIPIIPFAPVMPATVYATQLFHFFPQRALHLFRTGAQNP